MEQTDCLIINSIIYHCDAYIYVKLIITVPNIVDAADGTNNVNKKSNI